MTATFGEFLRPAGEHLALAVSHRGDLPVAARRAVIRQLDRLVTALAHYLGDVAPAQEPDTCRAGRLDREARAAMDARVALRRAAHYIRHGAAALEGARVDSSHPVVVHMASAADYLGAGRDVLQSHFARGTFGGWEGNSYWAPVITSRSVTTALVSELAGHARILAPWAAQLSISRPMDKALPTPSCLDLHAASRWLWIAGATLEEAQRHHPASAEGCRLLAAVPANFPPHRRPPADGEPVPGLCDGIAITAERLRHATIAFARRARWSPAASSSTWRKNALASAITGHSSEIVLRTLSVRADQLGFQPSVVTRTREAAQAMRQAWDAWRAITHEWDILSTGIHRTQPISPVTAEFGDLVLRMGRLAYQNPQWTPAVGTVGHWRDSATLAITARDVAAVLAAVHQAADATVRIGEEEMEAVRTASVDGRLYLPTRLMPDDYDVPRRYTPAPLSTTNGILATYGTAVEASTRVANALDTLASTLDAPSELLSALRAPPPSVPCNLPKEAVGVPYQRATSGTISHDFRTSLRA
ncbi:MAG: hypothetical protein J2P19_28220 [Pseudonocardia sp.]|nr:hypothetical protein [Pseudonocardia sp.]